MFTATPPMRFCNRLSRVIILGCLLALATTVAPEQGSANQLTICKQTIPSPAPSGTSFTFTGANGFPVGPNSFNSLYLSNQSNFQLQDSTSNPGNCRTFNLAGHDQFNKIKEAALPPGWTLTNISCNNSKSPVQIIGGNPNPLFQPGDNTMTIDQTEPSVTCTFINTCSIKKQDLSTGVAPWNVTRPNGQVLTPHTVAPNSNWASHSPPTLGGPPFPTGTSWVQPVNSSTLSSQPVGDYLYQLRFTTLCPGKLDGWFAADNAATLTVDTNAPVQCLGNPSLCFQQANVTSFSFPIAPGGHIIRVKVTNQGSITGLLAHITLH